VATLVAAANASAWTGPAGNNTWLLPGRVPTLIDAGVGAPAHLRALAAALGGASLQVVLITHGHVDHASGAAAMVARWPSVRVRQFGDSDPLQDGESVDAGDGELRVVHTPGHSPDHCSFFDRTTRDLFSGDLARIGGTVVIPASRGGNLAEYLRSLDLVRRLCPRRLLPGHGPIVEDPDLLIAEYLRHRAERDEQILQALHAGRRTAPAIVEEVYRGLPAAFVDAAADTVLAHLIKLRDEGRVREDGESWVQAG
jgi:glyoxylase-like metal-dependent hydrolase (beta-lactamase superfamily II)